MSIGTGLSPQRGGALFTKAIETIRTIELDNECDVPIVWLQTDHEHFTSRRIEIASFAHHVRHTVGIDTNPMNGCQYGCHSPEENLHDAAYFDR